MNRQLVTQLARCEYIERRENVIAIGNSGTGKTHIALGLGLAACQKGLTVGFPLRRTLHPCPPTVIRTRTQRSEVKKRQTSKFVAHKPFTDFRFLASLGMTVDKWEMSTQSGLIGAC